MFFLITEIFTAGFVLACFGIGAAAAAVLAFLGAAPAWQFGAFAVVSAAAVALSRRFADRVTADQGAGIGVAGDRMLGKRAIVLEAIDPDEAKGIVRGRRAMAREVGRRP
jgi:membrane protein implicated in regulation of membrane protease activity